MNAATTAAAHSLQTIAKAKERFDEMQIKIDDINQYTEELR